MLDDPASQHLICWAGRKLEFKLNEPEEVARLWGIQKNRPTMNYDKLSRSLRYYYEKGIISKVSGERYVYRFAYEPEVLAKLTLDDTLTAVLPAKPGKNWNSASPPVQDVIFPHPVLPPPNQTLPSPAPVQPLPPLPTPSAPVSEAQALPQEVMYQGQWEDQVVYNNTYEYEWSDTSTSTGFLSYPVNQQYEHAYSCDQINQVYASTDTDAENYVFLEYPDYFS